MTIIEYITGAFEADFFTENNIKYVLAKYDIKNGEAELDTIGKRERDLCIAELHLILANRTNGTGERIERGDFSINERSFQLTDSEREWHRSEANRIKAQYGEEDLDCSFHGYTRQRWE